MATTANHFILAMLLFCMFIFTSLDLTDGQVGLYFGRMANNLPSAGRTVALYKKYNIRRMRLFDPHPPTLRLLNGSNIEVTMGVTHADLPNLANCPNASTAWVRRYILRFPNVTIRYISVGNEIDPASEFGPYVFPAMQNLYRAIGAAGLRGQISVSTSISTDLLNTWYPPQTGEFKCSVNWFIRPILEFLVETRAPILSKIMPFYAFLNDKKNINLSFALLQPNSGVVLRGVYYDNLFYVLLDAVDAAMARILSAAASPLSVQPTEDILSPPSQGNNNTPPPPQDTTSGNPTFGGKENSIPESLDDGSPNTLDNARIYINNLMRIVRTGTPRRPGPIQTQIISMFDENLKPGPPYERSFGIFSTKGNPKFPFRFL